MGSKSPSKYSSLAFLRMLQLNDFCNKDKGVDYVPEEVNDLVWRKIQVADERMEISKEREDQKESLLHQKKNRYKMCSRCFGFKSFKDFHTDKSKKYFALRSWCKICRSS